LAAKHDLLTLESLILGEIRHSSALLDYRIKTRYGFDALVDHVEDRAKREQVSLKLRHLL